MRPHQPSDPFYAELERREREARLARIPERVVYGVHGPEDRRVEERRKGR